MATETVIGIDLGTQGVRMLAVDPIGEIIASASVSMVFETEALPNGRVEQDATVWWDATAACLRKLISALPPGVHIAGLSVDSTSGTIVPLTADHQPAAMAVMYNDARSTAYVAQVRRAAAELEQRLGYAFSASFALPKIVWLMHERPTVTVRAARYVHAADFIIGKLTGVFDVTDFSNALKTGYDLINNQWPAFLTDALGIPMDHLPKVVAPGQVVGHVSPQAEVETSLTAGMPVMAGATDGTAAQIASGAVEPGAWNSSLGTTLVIKGITKDLFIDPQRRIYSHRHPDGWWMPGGASNTGCEWIVREYAGQDPSQLDAQAAIHLPTQFVRYPLARTGERFPFLHAQATGFTVDDTGSAADIPSIIRYATGLEGTALVERLAYGVLRDIGAPVGDRIHATGGGSKSQLWLRIRASVLDRQFVRPHSSETAMGAALLAATGVWFHSLGEAAQAMVRASISVDPDKSLVGLYDHKYGVFCEQLRLRGYLQ